MFSPVTCPGSVRKFILVLHMNYSPSPKKEREREKKERPPFGRNTDKGRGGDQRGHGGNEGKG